MLAALLYFGGTRLLLWTPRAGGTPALRSAFQAQLFRNPFHRLDAERDVLLQINAQVGGAGGYVIAVYAAGEGFVFHLFSDRLGFDFSQRLARLDQSAGGNESG